MKSIEIMTGKEKQQEGRVQQVKKFGKEERGRSLLHPRRPPVTRKSRASAKHPIVNNCAAV